MPAQQMDSENEQFDEPVIGTFLRTYIRTALQDRVEGDNQLYTKLLCEMQELRYKAQRRDPDSVTQFVLLLENLADSLTQVRKEYHWDLFRNLYQRFDLWVADTSIRRVFIKLAINLALSSAEFVEPVTSFLVGCLFPAKEKLSRVYQADWGPWSPSERGSAIQSEILDGLYFLMKLRPASKLDINDYVQVKLIKPHHLWSKRWYCYYFRALLQLSDRDEGLREQFWGILLDLLIRLDTCIFWNHIQDQQAIADGEEQEEESRDPDEFGEVFQMEDDDQEDLQPACSKPEDGRASLPVIEQKSWADLQASSVLISYIQADKLDVLLEMVFSYINKWEERGEIMIIWRMMIMDFEKLLTAAECKFVTYIIFHIISKRPERFGPEFLELLWQKFVASDDSANMRRYCTSYISSFLCRSKLCPREQVFIYTNRMVQWILLKLPRGYYNLDGQFITDTEVYALFRGLLLILCYNMKPIFEHGTLSQQTELKSLIENDLVQIAEHPATVFKTTSKVVVQEFIDQTKSLKVGDFSKYAHEQEPQAQVKALQKKSNLRFPFDPFLLEGSSRHLNLEQTYVKFQSVKALFPKEEEIGLDDVEAKDEDVDMIEYEEKINMEEIVESPVDQHLLGTSIGGDSIDFITSPDMDNQIGTPLGGSPVETPPLSNYLDRLGEQCQGGEQNMTMSVGDIMQS